jgi:deoxyinosine 3'endonuclease (endonuclease V)
LEKVESDSIEAIVVDGFVVLDDFGKVGLGGHLFEKLNTAVAIIGVAKSGYHGIEKNVLELQRGDSKKPLFITAKGIELDRAHECLKSMHGNYRMPTLLQILGSKTKNKT